jgi:subtilase family serine protease
MLFTIPTLAQQTLPTRHARPVVTGGQAVQVGSLPSTQTLQLAIMLPVRNQAALTSLLGQLQDPHSPNYHQFLSVAQFTEEFGPTAEDYQKVINFAQANGFTVTDTPANRLAVFVSASAAQVESAFNVKMNVYQHPTENRTFFSPDREPSVNLDVRLWHIAGLDNYSIPRPLYQKGSVAQGNTTGSGSGGNFLGSDRRAAYYGGTSLTGTGQAVGLFELDGYNPNDVQAYFTNVGQSLNIPINPVLLLSASSGSDGEDTEQVIDIIEAASMAPGLSQILVYIAPISTFVAGTSDVDIFSRMATDDIAKQISVSWGWRPADQNSDDYYFEELEAQGQNVFVASGDDGAWVSGDFAYPAEDAYVTAVGGTELTTNGKGGSWASEIAWGGNNTSCVGYGSGGGISPDNISIPPYQQLGGVITASNYGSTTLRNGPDVAAEANCDNYYCANGACWTSGQPPLGGTSLAAPTWAGFMALVNQQAAAYGTAPNGLGFINPLIYPIGLSSNYGSDFHDITIGDNYNFPSPNLYPAVTGYDLVTGWGSPNGQNLINALAPQPPQAAAPTNSSNYIIEGGWYPTIEFTETLYDDTPGAEIYWQVSGNSGNPSGSDPLSSGDSFNLEYLSQYDYGPSGTIYATAPGYSPSATVPIYF